jgi:hypothetical protein
MSFEVEELAQEPEVCVAHAGSLLVFVWRGPITEASLDKTNRIEAELIERYGRVAVMGVITSMSSGIPTAELRQAASDAMRRFQPSVDGTAIVLGAEGTRAVIARTFLAGLSLVTDFHSPLKVYRRVADATAWLDTLGSRTMPAHAEVAAAIERYLAGVRG